jgi:hypothetical protein
MGLLAFEALVIENKMERSNDSLSTRVWIPVGAALFLVALVISEIVVPQLRLLHLFQSVIYIAIVSLARRNSAWGFGAGFMIGVAWNSLNLFVTHLMQAGLVVFWDFMQTGHVQRLDTMMVMVGGLAHFILIIACLVAFFNLPKDNKKWWKFTSGGVLSIVYMALIIIIARPR